jgi:gp32 DNA binding protein like
MSISALKKNRQSALEALNAELTKFNSKQTDREEDERFWQPAVDKAGNGNAIIRFLPAPEGENVPFIRYWEHAFKGPSGQWYWELCPTTIGKECPVCEHNNALWATGTESNKKLVSSQKRALRIVSNIYVLKDPANPDNEGKVFLYRYGKKIFDKINEKMHPSFEGEEPINPFDLWEGCHFRLKIRNVEGYRNYDKSEFEGVAPLHKDDDFLEKVWKQEFPLQPFVDPALFKDKATLKEKLDKVLGNGPVAASKPVESVSLPNVGKEAEVDLHQATDDVSAEFFKALAED